MRLNGFMGVVVGWALSCSMQVHADYLAYAVGENSRIPLPESIDGIEAKYLLNLEWGEYDGARSRIGVLEVDNTSNTSSFSVTGPNGESIDWSLDNANQVPVNGIEAIVTDVMNRTGRFRIVERQALASILQEQDLATSGRVSTPSGARTGNVLGAEYLVQVVVTDYESDISGTNAGGGLGGLMGGRLGVLGGLGFKSKEGRVGMNFRLIDAETSEVVYTRQIESLIKESGLTFGGLAIGGGLAGGGFLSNYARTPIGQAVIAGVNKGVYELIKQIGVAPASGSVVKAEAGRVWINIGAAAVSVGDELTVWAKGEELIDPDTGISLGSTDTRLGSIRVESVQPKFAIAREVDVQGSVSRGDRVVSTASPAAMEFATDWQEPRRGKF